MRPSFLLAATTMLVLGGCAPVPDRPDRFTETGRVIALGGGDAGARNACFRCHGMAGQGNGRDAPRLAGLEAGYLQKQLEDYGSETRPDKVMSPLARQLDDGDRRAVAAWYASLPAASVPASVEPHPAGRRLYLSGAPERGVQACAACHGADARGRGLANPALAGQPAAYTAEQLRRWKAGERRNDPRGVMGDVSRRLEAGEIDAVSLWLAAQEP